MVDAIMTPDKMKPLLNKAKEEPVSAAIGLTDKGEGVILLEKFAQPGQMLGRLRQTAQKANVKLESQSLRFGRAEIDTEDEAKLVKFIVNKEGTEKLRRALVEIVKKISFPKVVIEIDQSLEQIDENDKDQHGEGEGGEDTELQSALISRTRDLDKLQQILLNIATNMRENVEIQGTLAQAITALNAGRNCVTQRDSDGAAEQIKLATNAIRQITTPEPSSSGGSWKRPEPTPKTNEPQQVRPTGVMGQRKKHDLVPPIRQLPRSEQVQHAVTRRLLTGEELMQRLDKRPKKNILGGIFKQSTRFKAVLEALKPIDEFMNQTCEQVDNISFTEIQDKMNVSVNKALEPLEIYQKKLMTDRDDMQRKLDKFWPETEQFKKLSPIFDKAELKFVRFRDDRNHLSGAIESYQGDALKKTWQLIKSDPNFEKIKEKITIGQAIQIKSCGINFSDVDVENLNDTKIDKEQSKEQLGSGGINTVSKLVYHNNKIVVFKPMQDSRGKAMVAVKSGISNDDPHYENRNITSRLVAETLGTKVIPEATVGLHNGRVGLMMELAPGKLPLQAVSGLKGEKPSKEAIGGLQQQLMDLEWCDMISGQMDRHNKNYLVDMSAKPPKVTGIDNDLAFGPQTSSIGTLTNTVGYNGLDKPKLINRSTFQKLMGLDFDKHLRPGLKGRLTETEINSTQDRFNEMKRHAESLDSEFIVDNWETWTLTEGEEKISATQYLMRDPKPNSLFARDFKRFV